MEKNRVFSEYFPKNVNLDTILLCFVQFGFYFEFA